MPFRAVGKVFQKMLYLVKIDALSAVPRKHGYQGVDLPLADAQFTTDVPEIRLRSSNPFLRPARKRRMEAKKAEKEGKKGETRRLRDKRGGSFCCSLGSPFN